MVHEAVDGRERHGLVLEDLARISHEVERIGWENQRKWFCHKLLI